MSRCYHRDWPNDVADSADRVFRLRIALKWTTQQLADHCGVTTQSASYWETGDKLPSRGHAVLLLNLEASLPKSS